MPIANDPEKSSAEPGGEQGSHTETAEVDAHRLHVEEDRAANPAASPASDSVSPPDDAVSEGPPLGYEVWDFYEGEGDGYSPPDPTHECWLWGARPEVDQEEGHEFTRDEAVAECIKHRDRILAPERALREAAERERNQLRMDKPGLAKILAVNEEMARAHLDRAAAAERERDESARKLVDYEKNMAILSLRMICGWCDEVLLKEEGPAHAAVCEKNPRRELEVRLDAAERRAEEAEARLADKQWMLDKLKTEGFVLVRQEPETDAQRYTRHAWEHADSETAMAERNIRLQADLASARSDVERLEEAWRTAIAERDSARARSRLRRSWLLTAIDAFDKLDPAVAAQFRIALAQAPDAERADERVEFQAEVERLREKAMVERNLRLVVHTLVRALEAREPDSYETYACPCGQYVLSHAHGWAWGPPSGAKP